jgi:hypothetical protein
MFQAYCKARVGGPVHAEKSVGTSDRKIVWILPQRTGCSNDVLNANRSNTIAETVAILCCRDNRKGGSCQRQLCREAA